MTPSLLVAALAALFLAAPSVAGARDRFLRGLSLFGAAVFLSTEGLGAFAMIHRATLVAWWIAVIVGASILSEWKRILPRVRADPVTILCGAGIAGILVATFVVAGFSPPNSADAMAYHMPRVVYWAEQSSVRFFPTAYFNQIMLQPFAEYLMLHAWVLSGGDRYVNFVQWLGFLGSIVGVSGIARELGAAARGQAIAALFCATLPAAIYASTGAKNDLFLAMWLICSAYFALRHDALYLGVALGLALLTKATGYLFAPWILAAIFIGAKGRVSWRRPAAGLLIALAINTPQYIRNYQFSGSVMGFDSAQGDGLYRWRNETFGWRPAVSNALRNVSEQLGARGAGWNRGVYDFVVAAHRRMGIDPNDPASTWPGSTFEPPVNANHEANANNRWHLALLLIVLCALIARAFHGRDRERSLYALGIVCGFTAFCAYLKWQPFLARLLLPLFILSAPLAAMVAEAAIVPVQLLVCLFLLNNARPAVFENWVRPLKGPQSVLRVSRDAQYFSDMTQWNNRDSYTKAVALLADSRCGAVGIDIADNQLEYPIQALLRERNPAAVFVHTGLNNASSRYRPPVEAPPCAVVCLDCAQDEMRLSLYREFQTLAEAGRFVIFTRR